MNKFQTKINNLIAQTNNLVTMLQYHQFSLVKKQYDLDTSKSITIDNSNENSSFLSNHSDNYPEKSMHFSDNFYLMQGGSSSFSNNRMLEDDVYQNYIHERPTACPKSDNQKESKQKILNLDQSIEFTLKAVQKGFQLKGLLEETINKSSEIQALKAAKNIDQLHNLPLVKDRVSKGKSIKVNTKKSNKKAKKENIKSEE